MMDFVFFVFQEKTMKLPRVAHVAKLLFTLAILSTNRVSSDPNYFLLLFTKRASEKFRRFQGSYQSKERSSDYVGKELMSFTFAGGVVTHTLARKNSLVELPSRMKKIEDSWQKRIAGHDDEIPEQLLSAFLCLALADIQKIRNRVNPRQLLVL